MKSIGGVGSISTWKQQIDRLRIGDRVEGAMRMGGRNLMFKGRVTKRDRPDSGFSVMFHYQKQPFAARFTSSGMNQRLMGAQLVRVYPSGSSGGRVKVKASKRAKAHTRRSRKIK